METKLIYQKIPAIMSKVGAIGKDRTNTMQNYKFRGIDDMYNALNAHLAEEKVFFTSEVIGNEREERTNSKGTVLIYSILTMRFKAYAEDGSFVESVTVGEAMDSGDKSMNKAMSTAYKYALMQIFCIPTEDEKDTEYETHELAPKKKYENKPASKSDTDACPNCGTVNEIKHGDKDGKKWHMGKCACGETYFVNPNFY